MRWGRPEGGPTFNAGYDGWTSVVVVVAVTVAVAAPIVVIIVATATAAVVVVIVVVVTSAAAAAHHLVIQRLRIQMVHEVAAVGPLDLRAVHHHALSDGVVFHAVRRVDG